MVPRDILIDSYLEGTEGGVREGGFEDRKAETFADVGDAGRHRVHRQRLRYTQIERVPGFRQSPLLRLPLVLRACRQSPRPPLSPGGGQRVQLRHRIDDRNTRLLLEAILIDNHDYYYYYYYLVILARTTPLIIC